MRINIALISVISLLFLFSSLFAEVFMAPEELSQYNGKNKDGLVYIALHGVVYDVTKLPSWKSGYCNGYVSGQDLTNYKDKILDKTVSLKTLPVIAKLVKGFSAKQLSKFDGQNGKAPYIAVNGLVYDVSRASGLSSGQYKTYAVGKDWTDALKNDAELLRQPIVGKLIAVR